MSATNSRVIALPVVVRLSRLPYRYIYLYYVYIVLPFFQEAHGSWIVYLTRVRFLDRLGCSIYLLVSAGLLNFLFSTPKKEIIAAICSFDIYMRVAFLKSSRIYNTSVEIVII